jgi:hypothetical protein
MAGPTCGIRAPTSAYTGDVVGHADPAPGTYQRAAVFGHLVAYLLAADNFIGPLLSRLRGTQQPVVRPRHAFSAPRSHLLARL